jgi:dinuclear metal center YbgI/SA1388 family protein
MSLFVSDIVEWFEEWTPRWAAWEKDNVGLQVGNRNQKIFRILVTLDVTKKVVSEAIAGKADCIISHHPLLFRPLASVTTSESVGEMVLQLAQHKISLFSAHTNLDCTEGGVSFALAEKLGLQNIRFLSPLKNSLAKIVVFVPESHRTAVMQAMIKAGAGIIGKYSSCSFSTQGIGSFFGSSTSQPFLGKSRNLEFAEEVRLEMISPRARIKGIITEMKAVHPYEEVAYDVFHVENPNPNFGMGAIGTLPKPQPLKTFLKFIKKTLRSEVLRFTDTKKTNIQNVAVCGGSGSELLSDALAANADVFVTADVRYHTFHAAAHTLAIVDAGHWETEQIVLKPIADRIRAAARKANEPLTVWVSQYKTNPITTI